ncbi:hypothetical protein EVAR_54446_1 [Eumeta japonica]|uniref:Uncharacterized protein n=1 Tax=Eumeta variegata TaxID=151549 RepID=A0A4C1XMV2_EUMVA|nr:hypothetical protein EVAR_54446_1 [Eumeta japonica]
MGQSLSTRNRRAYMKRLMNVNEARDICEDRNMWKPIVSAYPSGSRRQSSEWLNQSNRSGIKRTLHFIPKIIGFLLENLKNLKSGQSDLNRRSDGVGIESRTEIRIESSMSRSKLKARMGTDRNQERDR